MTADIVNSSPVSRLDSDIRELNFLIHLQIISLFFVNKRMYLFLFLRGVGLVYFLLPFDAFVQICAFLFS